ncbi:MAG: right-handed parallel beta-helix repeat-containing protein [Trueperaceae bacterium]
MNYRVTRDSVTKYLGLLLVLLLTACQTSPLVISNDSETSTLVDVDSLAIPSAPTTARYYVALSGSNTQGCNGGTKAQPFASIQKAIECVKPGDTVFLRGGRYLMPTTPEFAAYIYLETSGTETAPITFMSQPGEWAILDFSKLKGGEDTERVYIAGADWLVFRNLEIFKSPQQGIYLEQNADHNMFINVVLKESWGTGFQIYQGSSNTVMCSDAVDSGKNNTVDPGNSDGFSSGGQGGPSVNNRLYYNLAHHNADDGFDTWVSQNSFLVRNVSSNNGYNGGNGNGFKLGPGPVPNNRVGYGTGWTTDPPREQWFQAKGTLRRNVAYSNLTSGFDNNSGAGNTLDNNTAWNNPENFTLYKNENNPNNAVNVLRNNLSYQGGLHYLSPTEATKNSWNLGITNPNFASVQPRDSTFLSLAVTSSVVDKGASLPWLTSYAGAAPDLGALELGRNFSWLRSGCPKRP